MKGNVAGRKAARFLKTALFLATVVALVVLVVIYRGQVSRDFVEHYPVLILIACVIFVSMALQAYNFLQLLGMGKRIPLVKVWRLWAVANLANYLGPLQPGLAVRAVYFKSRGISVLETTRTTLRQLLLSLWVASGLTVVGLFHEDALVRLFSAGGCIVFLLAPWIISGLQAAYRPTNGDSGVAGLVRSLLGLGRLGMPVYRLWPFVLQYLLMAVNLFAVYNEFGVVLGLDESILFAVIFALTALFSITPNNLGLQELLLGSVAHWGGLSAGEALSVAVICRAAHMVACVFVVLVTIRK